MESIKYKLDKLELNGTPDKKDIVILKFTEDGSPDQVKSLYAELQTLKGEANWENVSFLILPPHIHLNKISDQDLDDLGLCRK